MSLENATIHRKFLKSSFEQNNNKFWEVWWRESDGEYLAVYGRVGDTGQQDSRQHVNRGYVEKKIREKTSGAKYPDGVGYVELDLHVPQAAVVAQATQSTPSVVQDARVARLVETIFREANEHIKATIAVTVDALSQSQITAGRLILKEIMGQPANTRKGYVQRYYNTIPTVMDRRPDIDQLVRDFDEQEQEDRLNQLEAALSTYQATQAAPTGTSQYDLLGASLKWLDWRNDVAAQHIARTFESSSSGARVTGIYEVEIPHERKAFDKETFGDHNHALLWHGTKAQNVRHILKTGFKIPDFFSNGWMFGPGIYLADEARKSQNYASARYGDTMMFLCEAKLGDAFLAPDAGSYKQAPHPYHHVFGKAGHTRSWGGTLRMNEFIVYKTSQVTIRYLVTYR
jgi:hypothetical protein